jgi:hypothetical protein
MVPRAALLPLLVLAACQVPGDTPLSSLETRAEATDYVETSRYDDVVEFMERVAGADARIHLTTMGYTFEGRAIPLAVVGDVSDPSPETVLASGKTRVYLQGNIHGGEVPGKEALQMLLRDIGLGAHPEWFDSLVLLVVPIYNADGNERVRLTNRPRQHGPVGGMGQRPNAQGLDLNRDHMKLDSPEARSLVAMMNAYDPHVAVDLHTTNGTRHAYHVTYAEPLNPATASEIVGFLREDWLPTVTRAIKDRHGWDYYYYGNAFAPGGGDMGWYTFDHRPRFNNNYVGLRNRLAILSEAYSYATFEDRVQATYWFVEEILNFAHTRARDISRITEEVDGQSVVGRELAVRSAWQESPQPVEILMGEVDREQNPWSGEVMLRRRDVSVPTPMREFVTFRATETSTAPAEYLVPGELSEVLDRLRAHGILLESLDGDIPRTVDVFQVETSVAAERAFQGHNERTLTGAWVPGERTVGEGWFRVPVDQPLGRLAFYLLEPRSDDGLVNWGFLDEALEGVDEYPVFRVPASPDP